MAAPQTWKAEAACIDHDLDLFFPESEHGGYDFVKESLAKAVCARCPVREECLEWALYNERQGIWGGTSERQRAKIRRNRHIRRNRTAVRTRGRSRGAA